MQQGLEIAIDLADLALQAEFLDAIASLTSIEGDPQRAIAMWSDALEKAKSAKSLYVQSQVSGDRARQQLVLGRLGEAEADLQNALQIDEVNDYGLKRLHYVYKAYALLARSDQNLESTLKLLKESREKAKSAEDWYTDMLATQAVALIDAKTGKVEEALSELASVSRKNASPIIRIMELENIGGVLEVAGKLADAVQKWEELHDVGLNIKNDLIVFESNTHAASLFVQQNRPEEAVPKYKENLAIAVHHKNNAAVIQVLSALTVLIQKHPNISTIAPLYEQLLGAIAEHADDRSVGSNLTFITLVQLGNEYKRLTQFEKADGAYRAAELLDPESLDKLSTDPKQARALIEFLHISHATVLESLHRDLDALLQAFRAFDSAVKAGDDKAYDPIAVDINALLLAEEPYVRLQRYLDEKQYWNALRLSEALFLEESWNSDWLKAHAEQSKKTLNTALQAIEGMGTVSDAPALLEGNLQDIPPDFIGLRTIVARKIAQMNLFRDSRPENAKRFIKILLNATGPGADRTVFEAQCWMALAEMQTGNGEGAMQRADECSQRAASLDIQARDYANTVESVVHLVNFAVPSAESVSAVVKVFGDKPDFRDSLARAYANKAEFESAIAEAEKAIQMFVASGKYAEAGNEALYCSLWSRSRGSTDHLTKYVDLARDFFARVSDSDGVARADLEESRLWDMNGDNSKALALAKRAREAPGSRMTVTGAQATLWLAQLTSRTRPIDSVALFKEAIELGATALSPSVQVEALDSLSGVLEQLHQNAEALAALQKAEGVAKLSTLPLDQYSAAVAVGRFYEKTGDMQAALAAYSRAELAAAAFPVQQGFALIAQAAVLEILGDWQGAEDRGNKAVQQFKLRNYKQGIVWAIGELVSTYADRGSDLKDFGRALSLYESALLLDPKAGSALAGDIIEIYLQQKDYRRAENEAQKKLKECGADSSCQAHMHISLAETYIGEANFKAAEGEVKAAEMSARKDDDVYLHGRLIYMQGKLALARGRYQEAAKELRSVCDLIGRVGDDTADTGARIRTNYSYIYDDLLRALQAEYAAGNRQAAWTAVEYAEQEAASSFDLRWRRLFLDRLRTQLDPALRDREREITAGMADLRSRLGGARGTERGQSVVELKADLEHLGQQMNQLKNELRMRAPRYAAIAFPAPILRTNLSLGKNEILFRVHVAPDTVYEWISVPGANPPDLKFYALSLDRQKLRSLVEEMRGAFDQGRPDLLKAATVQAVSNLVLLPEVRELLRTTKRLIYVPDDCLFLIPLEMLLESEGKSPSLAITYYPSIRDVVISRTARTEHNSWQKAFLGFADPITADDDPRLLAIEEISGARTKPADMEAAARRGVSLSRIPGTAEEVNAIGKLFDNDHLANEVHLGSDASKGRVLHTDFTQFRYIHFATHGLLPADSGINEPALVLSRDARTDDVLLSMTDILGLKLNSDLVVLSACNTGSGKLVRGEGVMNLGKSFMSAGSSSVAMSLWQVSDTSTSLLMQSFYKHLLAGDSKAVALSKARDEVYAAGYSNPFFWAPFILVGD